jgi:hypothetical protein
VASILGVTFFLLDDDIQEPVRERIAVTGAQQTVFDWTSDACEPRDIPDSPARAFRDAAGNVELIASHYVTRRMIGPSLDAVDHQCEVVMGSAEDPRPEQFNDREWLTAPYTADGRRVFALLHEEYQGHRHAGRCASGNYFKCWYNAITFAVSTDGGRSFRNGRIPPEHLVASVPYRYTPDVGPYGLFQPSNIVRRPDGYYYVLIRAAAYRGEKSGVCLLRTARLEDPSSWRAWDGTGYRTRFSNPYARMGSDARTCERVAHPQIADMTQSLTYNTFLKRFVLVGSTGKFDPRRNETVWGIYFATSENLTGWSERQLVMETELPHVHRCGDPSLRVHPSVLDPRSQSRNFETVGEHAYLYFTRVTYDSACRQNLARDLLRVPITFSR